MIQQAFISGQIGQVIYTDDDRYFVLNVEHLEKPVECRPMDLSTFFNFGAEFTTLSGTQLDLGQLKSQLVTQRQAYLALTLIISGMDDELDEETRAAAIEAAERHISEEAVHEFVRARMLARPLPEEADIENALNIAIRFDAAMVALLYRKVIDCQQAIDLVSETWLEAAPDYFSSFEERVEGEKTLIDLGVFAELALDLSAGDLKALSSVVITYGQKPELNSKLRQGVLILNDLKTRLAKKWAAPSTKRRLGKKERRIMAETDHIAENADPVHQALARFKQRREHPRSKTFSADEAKSKVDHQIEAISRLIRQGNINRADRYLNDLINFHVEHSEREHLGMSLCSLAKVAIDSHAFELAEKMVDYALMLGIEDVVILNTHAQMFKAMGRFDDALQVYEETMARFPNNEVARGGYAEVFKVMGRFDDALRVYEEAMKRFTNNRVTRTGYASVLMLMNRFEEVRALLSDANPSSKDDWIDYHIIAMSYLKSGDIDEAIRRLAYGRENSQWLNDRNYFETALGVAKIKKEQFTEVLDILPSNVISLDIFQRQTRLALIGHAQAALGKRDEAVQTLAQLEQASNPRVINLKQAISRRYSLGQQSDISLSEHEIHALDERIEEEEFFLAMAA